jgi:hypothetical protein
MMRTKFFKKKIRATFLFSIIVSLLAIVHGLFFDLDTTQLQRLTLEGFLLTFVLVFSGLLILEWIFDIGEQEEIKKLKRRISRLEKK